MWGWTAPRFPCLIQFLHIHFIARHVLWQSRPPLCHYYVGVLRARPRVPLHEYTYYNIAIDNRPSVVINYIHATLTYPGTNDSLLAAQRPPASLPNLQRIKLRFASPKPPSTLQGIRIGLPHTTTGAPGAQPLHGSNSGMPRFYTYTQRLQGLHLRQGPST